MNSPQPASSDSNLPVIVVGERTRGYWQNADLVQFARILGLQVADTLIVHRVDGKELHNSVYNYHKLAFLLCALSSDSFFLVDDTHQCRFCMKK